MKIKTGIDAVEISRIKKSMENSRFLSRIFSEAEYKYYKGRGLNAESIAGAYCAKEAFSKAVGTGISGFSFNEVEVLHDENGKPYINLLGNAKRVAGDLEFELSITHTKTTAMAVVVAHE